MARKQHEELNCNDLMEWVTGREYDYAFRLVNGRKIALTVTLQGGYKVYVDGEIVWQGVQPFVAVEKFNSYL